jgi:tRNA(His) 5'-end guanylyltransferase
MDTSKQTLKEKCEAMKASTNYIIEPDTYVVLHLDGRGFSHRVKKVFQRPFDEKFVHAMDKTMKYLMANIQGSLIGYAQSDEINIILSDKTQDPNVKASPFFGYRLNKIQSICASMCGAKFNRIMLKYLLDGIDEGLSPEEYVYTVDEICDNAPLYSFDCKAFPAKDVNDAYAWLLYRQHDCVKNSRAQVAQYYLPHKALVGLTSEQQIERLKEQKGVDWNTDFRDGLKYGRYCIYKKKMMVGTNPKSGEATEFERSFWDIEEGQPIDSGDFKEFIMSSITRHEEGNI